MSTTAAPGPEAPTTDRPRRRRFWRRLALGAALALSSCAGGVAGCIAWVVPDRDLAEDARAGGVGEALDEALRRGDAEPLADYLRRTPGTRVCIVYEYMSLSGPSWRTYWRTYGLPNIAVPDAHWAITVLRAGAAPEFAVVLGQRLFFDADLDLGSGRPHCADAERLRLGLVKGPGRSLTLRVSDKS